MTQGHEPYVIVHSVFCFTLLLVWCCILCMSVWRGIPPHTPPRPRVFTPRERKTFYKMLFVGILLYPSPQGRCLCIICTVPHQVGYIIFT